LSSAICALAEEPPTEASGNLGQHLLLSKKATFTPDEGYQAITIGLLADYKLKSKKPDDLDEFEKKHFISNQIPAEILRLNDQQIQVEGYIYPLELEGDKVTVFLLLPGQMACCFSKMPELNEYVYVEMEEGIEVKSDSLAMVYGNLTMGDRVFESLDESVVYLLKGTKVKVL
jgi:hypothetical protein